MSDDPLHYYVRDKGSAVAHHWDYDRSRTDHALCGYPYKGPVWEGEDRPRAVCRACQALLPPHEVRWWRRKAEGLQMALESLRQDGASLSTRNAELDNKVGNLRREIQQLSGRAQADKIKKSNNMSQPDNTQEAVSRRVRGSSGPMSAADIPPRPPIIMGRLVSGGLPGLGKRR